MLYLIATPIGNLQDIAHRAIEILRSCDLILCEDTRHSRVLLDRYDIQTPLKSHHQFNETKEIPNIIDLLQSGQTIALISDAGTPSISDPGQRLVAACREANLSVSGVPGPSAAVHALSLSGLSTERFQFVGFVPKKESERQEFIIQSIHYKGVTIAYESPHRIRKTLTDLTKIQSPPTVGIARELTKIHEEVLIGSPTEILDRLADPPKGEFVFLIQGEGTPAYSFKESSIQEHVDWLVETFSLSKSEAIKLAAQLRGVPKQEVYRHFHQN